MTWSGIEPTTSRSQVRRANHSATLSPIIIHLNLSHTSNRPVIPIRQINIKPTRGLSETGSVQQGFCEMIDKGRQEEASLVTMPTLTQPASGNQRAEQSELRAAIGQRRMEGMKTDKQMDKTYKKDR
ncbi:hypothetical protein ElyMa_004609800 [Elysia marginata]|uniref:Uncharacterized protein n=1 Tax=Elysia marginata TaxID=1093978 RepID=A0AAV4HYY5_9GAST|nr:hypothetical protein ElyMa_004609800 [Elysia marginata]